jgi:hypothetical protein
MPLGRMTWLREEAERVSSAPKPTAHRPRGSRLATAPTGRTAVLGAGVGCWSGLARLPATCHRRGAWRRMLELRPFGLKARGHFWQLRGADWALAYIWRTTTSAGRKQGIWNNGCAHWAGAAIINHLMIIWNSNLHTVLMGACTHCTCTSMYAYEPHHSGVLCLSM